MFSKLVSDIIILFANVTNVCYTDVVSLASAVAIFTVAVGGARRYLTPYLIDEYISQFVVHPDACRFALKPVDPTLTVKVGKEERETAYAG